MLLVRRRECVILLVVLSCGALIAMNRMYLSAGVFGSSFSSDSGFPYVLQSGLRGAGKDSPNAIQLVAPVTSINAQLALRNPSDTAAGDNSRVAGAQHVAERPSGNGRLVKNKGEHTNQGSGESSVVYDKRHNFFLSDSGFHFDSEPWTWCAASNENCQCMGFVRYAGNHTRASYGATLCAPAFFLSSLQGDHCECQHVELIRPDGQCGLGVPPRPDGDTWECDPSSATPCCAKGACRAASASACGCEECADWRARVFAPRTWAGQIRQAETRKHSTRVAIIVPFRDQDKQLATFKEHLKWFVKHGAPADGGNVTLEVFVVEQFDEKPFNPGWLFNVGFLLSQKARAAPFDCIVVQDVTLLPLDGVDYGDCGTPIQLSAEMDTHLTRVPFARDVSGILAMSPAHWLQINGFSPTYDGQGSEADLFLRLESAKLLFGNGCYPMCSGRGDTRMRSAGHSIRRPIFGRGRVKTTVGTEPRNVMTDRAKLANHKRLVNERRKAAMDTRKFLAETEGIRNTQVELVHVTHAEVGGIQYSHAWVRAERGGERDKKPMDISAVLVRGPGCEFALDADLFDEAALQATIAKTCEVGSAKSQSIQAALTQTQTKVAKMLDEVSVTKFVRHLARGADGVIYVLDSAISAKDDNVGNDRESMVDDLLMEMEEEGDQRNDVQDGGGTSSAATTEEYAIKGTWTVPTQFLLCSGVADAQKKSGGGAIFKWDQLPNTIECTERGFKQHAIWRG